MLKYTMTAGSLGAGWFAVLLIPSLTREWLLADAVQNLACLVVASVVIAIPARGFIRRADTFGQQLLRATVLPWPGCVAYLSLRAALMWARTILFGGLANVHDTISLFVMGLTAALLSFYVVIPYGLFCQYVMKSAMPAPEDDADGRSLP